MNTPDNTPTPFTPINELERTLLQAVTNPAARAEFYKVLLDHDVLMLAMVDQAAVQDGKADQDTPVQVLTWMKGEEAIVPLFSAVERLQEAIKDSGAEFPYVIMNGRMLFTALSQGNLNAVLNPRCQLGKEFTVQEMRDLMDGTLFTRLEQGEADEQQILLGQPAEEPTELLDAFREVFTRHAAIEAAHLALAQDPTSGLPPRILIGLQVSGSVDDAVSDAGVILDQLPEEIGVEFVVMDGGDIDTYFLQQTTPFYRKGELYASVNRFIDDTPDYDLVSDEEDDDETDSAAEAQTPAQPEVRKAEDQKQEPRPSESRPAQGSLPRPTKVEKKPWWKVW